MVDTVEERGVAAEIVTSSELEGMSLDQLGRFASEALGEGRRMQAEAVALSRKSTVLRYRAGRALWHAKKRMKSQRAWTRFQREHGIPISTARQAILLFERAGSEEDLAGLTLSQAFKEYDIIKPKKDQPSQSVATEMQDQAAGVSEADSLSATLEGPYPDPSTSTTQIQARRSHSLPTTTDTSADRCSNDARERSSVVPHSSVPTGTTVSASDALVMIVRKLEYIERDFLSVDLAPEDLDLIDQAIGCLRRMQGGSVQADAA